MPYLSFTSTESKKDSMNDKLKNNLINKIYDLETKLSQKENIIIRLTKQIESLNTNNKNYNIDKKNALSESQNSDNKNEQINDLITSQPKSTYKGLVTIARNSIYSFHKVPLTTRYSFIKQSDASSNTYKNDNFNDIYTEIKDVNNFEIHNGNNKPEFYQRKKNNLVNEQQRSRSVCDVNANNQSVSGLDINFSVFKKNETNKENELNNSFKSYNNKDYLREETDLNRDSKEQTQAQTEPQININNSLKKS